MPDHDGPTGTWQCKIGSTDKELPPGCDLPMRRAVEAAYTQITGEEPEFVFSGWSAELTESELEALEALERGA